MQHPLVIALIVATVAGVFAWLATPTSRWHFLRMFATSAALLAALMGLGAVFGKTLGDFLRNQ